MSDFFYGVIEGFYGRQWSWAERADYAGFLADYGFDCYIYAPKGEAALRSQWRQGLPPALVDNLRAMAERYRQRGLRWGLGLSPLGLFEHYGADDRSALQAVVAQINALGPDLLCILFDDLRGDFPQLARRQLEVVATILDHSRAGQHLVCPTYYSFDPVLEQVFGAMPADYLEELGAGLPAEVGIFWTGDQVIAPEIGVDSVERAGRLLGRAPVLWDNYPVNDGRSTCSHLHLRPYQGRPAALREAVPAHIVNPMNQSQLSRLVLQTLHSLYSAPDGAYSVDGAWADALASLHHSAFAEQLSGDRERFQVQGLDAIDAAEKARLGALYRSFQHPAADEVADWLAGAYQFDPACLTG